MIHVSAKPEPISFDKNVRRPGQNFLNPFLIAGKKPKNKHFSKKNFWQYAIKDLHAAYNGICAYTCFYMVDRGTVDHFVPKSKQPKLAYEWSNYRLCRSRVNQYKKDSMDVIDPFIVQNGWFVLDFPSCLVRPNDGLSPTKISLVLKSIEVLKLNDDDAFVQERCDLMMEYADKNISLSHLSKRYPFLASEITRQGIQNEANLLFKRRN